MCKVKRKNSSNIEVTTEKRIKKAINERIEKEKLELKELILRTAAQLFLEKGYEKFSLRQVAERIGYSATTIYLYFKDKDDLLFSIVLEGFEIFYKKLLKAENDNNGDTLKQLFAVGKAYIEFGVEYPIYYQVMFMQRTDFLLKTTPGEDEPMIASFRVLSALVQKAIDQNIFKNMANCHQIYTNLLWATVHGIVSLHIVMPAIYTVNNLEKSTNEGLELLVKGFMK